MTTGRAPFNGGDANCKDLFDAIVFQEVSKDKKLIKMEYKCSEEFYDFIVRSLDKN